MSILTVGPGQRFSTIASAVAASQDGDVLLVRAGTYTNDFATIKTKITIKGVGGMAQLVATVPPPNGKAILTVNTDVTLDHLDISGSKVADRNGAAIRYQGGNLTITSCYLHDNENGILGGGPGMTLTIDRSEVAFNGYGDGYSHNLYIGQVDQFTVTNSYIHDAKVGHEIKSRALSTTILHSTITDNGNNASYSIDMPQGGVGLIADNVIQQSATSQNPTIVAFGEETPKRPLHPNSSLVFTGNTVVNDLVKASSLLVWNKSASPLQITGNQIYGLSGAQMVKGVADLVADNLLLGSRPALAYSQPWAKPRLYSLLTTGEPTPDTSDDTLVLRVSGTPYYGAGAQFILRVDGNQVGGTQTVSAIYGRSQQDFVFSGFFGPGPHQVEIDYINDVSGGTSATDRNLFVRSVTLNGQTADIGQWQYVNGALGFVLDGQPAPITTYAPVAP